jgi:dTDP-4-amino-4,6-dideoxygalactose transaminase
MNTAIAQIPLFDYVEQFRAIEEEILEAMGEVLASGTLVLGPRVRQFERSFAEYLGAGEAVGVGNGTDALVIALKALGIGPGDEVITVANTALPTASAIRMTGATPAFCEIDPATLLMDLDDLQRRITPRTRAVVPVHLFGNAVEMPRLVAIARRHRLAVVEDCAQSCGTTIDAQHTGTFGDVGCFSFYPTKNLGAYGDGGCCVTNSDKLAAAMREIRQYGRGDAVAAHYDGVNSRLDELQAAVLEVKLRRLPGYVTRRRELAKLYAEHLDSRIIRPLPTPGTSSSFHLFVIQARDRRRLMTRLKSEGVDTGIHYPVPIHRMPAYSALGYEVGSLPITEHAAERIISLPCYPELSPARVRDICEIVNDAEFSGN